MSEEDLPEMGAQRYVPDYPGALGYGCHDEFADVLQWILDREKTTGSRCVNFEELQALITPELGAYCLLGLLEDRGLINWGTSIRGAWIEGPEEEGRIRQMLRVAEFEIDEDGRPLCQTCFQEKLWDGATLCITCTEKAAK